MKTHLYKIVIVLIFLLAFLGFIQSTSAQLIHTYAGNGSPGFSGDGGPASGASLFLPLGVAADASGNLYIADYGNGRIRKISSTGVITTFAGTGATGFSGDGGQATAATFHAIRGVACDGAGNVYVADALNNRVRKINSSGIISTIAGTGSASFSGDGGAATLAALNSPDAVICDLSGNLFIADMGNNRIRMINSSGIISTVAGNGTAGFGGDNGPATSASLSGVSGLCFDASGNLFIADENNNRIRKVNNSGIITTYAGTGTGGYAGDYGQATSAELSFPSGVCTDASGNLYIADQGNNVIRQVTTNGLISTLAGTGSAGYSGDGGSASLATLNAPYNLTCDNNGNLYIADYGNEVVRSIGFATGLTARNKQNPVSVYPNPGNGLLHIRGTEILDEIQITDLGGKLIQQLKPNSSQADIQLEAEGLYFMTIYTQGKPEYRRIVVFH